MCYLCELSDAWQWDLSKKLEHEVKLNHTKMCMIRRMCEVKLNERKKSEEIRTLWIGTTWFDYEVE